MPKALKRVRRTHRNLAAGGGSYSGDSPRSSTARRPQRGLRFEGYYVPDSRLGVGRARPHVGHVTRATHDLLRFWEFALHGRGCRGYPGRPYQGGRAILSLFPRPSFIALNIYPAPLHLVSTSMRHEIVRGISGASDRGYARSWMRTSENATSRHLSE